MTLYTPDEVAGTLKISPKTVIRQITTGVLQAAKIGRQWRISDDQLNEFLASRTTKKRKTA